MDNLQSAAQAFAALSFKGRLPTWKEYETGSPAEQRAIIERWFEIRLGTPRTDEEWNNWTAATGRHSRALLGNRPVKLPEKWWHEDYLQGDYESSGISDTTQGDLSA